MVHKLVVEVPVQSILRSSSVIRHQLYRSELGIEEGCVVAVTPASVTDTRGLSRTRTLPKKPSF